MHIVTHIIWRKKLEDYDEIPNYKLFEKQCGQTFPLDVYFSQK